MGEEQYRNINMIPVTEFRQFSEQQPAFRVLKPWWDVFTDYLSVAMLMIGVFGCTLQMCYERALHWYAKYFPYLVLIHTLVFMLCSNFWFKFPGSSSKIEHFISILGKCFDSPWTTRALSEVSGEDSEEKDSRKNNMSRSNTTQSGPEGSLVNSQSLKSIPEKFVVDKSTAGALDKKEGEQAKALFEKVKKFRLHVEEDTVFEITELQSLKLEIIKNVMIPATIAQLDNLQELSLHQCSVKIHSAALSFLKENLKVLSVKFDDMRELPPWMYGLRNLEELYLVGSLSHDISRNVTLESLRDLKSLKILSIKSNVSKIPQAVVDVSSHLQKMCIHNDGTKLVMLNNLKKMTNLTELELVHCDLERIPHAVFSLLSLQELDLKENNLKSIEEIVSFQHLRKLTVLKLWHNSITYIPEHIKKLTSLERLSFSHNKIENS
ncbi:LRRC8C [Cervus elaphus hippelaphus]|uniref:LRRC8C n=1 Tax=Cervus elaphus hippelaphus TaxID=46360 RepID=A0A212CHE1_CEREH|nr:LRRC8C [Cervus elaphus hippelaphus]